MSGAWFTEAPWPPAIIGLVLVALTLVTWYKNQKPYILVIASLVLACCAIPFIVDAAVLTEGERLEDQIHELVGAFQRNETDTLLKLFSPQEAVLRALAISAVNRVDILGDVVIRDYTAELLANASRARTKFRVNGTFVADGQNLGSQPTRWLFDWRKENDAWKIVGVTRLNPMKDEVIEVFSAPSGS